MEASRSASELEGNLDMYSFFVFCFFPFLLLCVTQIWITASCCYSTNQHLTKEYIYKPLACGAIRKWLIIQSALVHPNCMCLKSNRKKSGRRSLTKKGRVFALERRGTRKLNGDDASPPSASICCKSSEHLALGEEKGRTPLTSPLLGTQSQLMINDRHLFGKGKVKDFSPPG